MSIPEVTNLRKEFTSTGKDVKQSPKLSADELNFLDAAINDVLVFQKQGSHPEK